MLLTITNRTKPVSDLSFLLHKHPSKTQSFSMSFGAAHVFYPQVDDERCTVALLLDVDPIKLVRGSRKKSHGGGLLEQYVNDRPYVVSSFLSVAIAKVFGSALSGKEKDHAELVKKELDLEVKLAVMPCEGGESLLHRLFEPLGYKVKVQSYLLDDKFLNWGESSYFTVELSYAGCLNELLSHLYVLIPVLDNEKHYWVGEDEVEKLLHHGAKWLAKHPDRELIAKRYLKHQRSLFSNALTRLADEDNSDPDQAAELHEEEERDIEKQIGLNEQRLKSVISILKDRGVRKVIDLGCGEGRLLKELMSEKQFVQISGLDVAFRSLQIAKKRLQLESLAPKVRDRLKLIHGSLLYRDKRLAGYDAAVVIEVIEHLDSSRLAIFERVLFEFAKPRAVIITTPNIEYNVKFGKLPAGQFRHKDHRFEWTREEFQKWAKGVAGKFGYSVDFMPIGPEDPILSAPTQMGVFSL
ncbi:MAG: 3' terminal RNA ribose 2'-O-methyltransferase Hen1 [Candidatus Omnitrophica bacterium]|nr:3' terminal RNA ribose 2'-O-methyltransferase Hen1 [Candidatus Omnitrophota bacterium]